MNEHNNQRTKPIINRKSEEINEEVGEPDPKVRETVFRPVFFDKDVVVNQDINPVDESKKDREVFIDPEGLF